jgi:hypothetical protein
MRQKTVCCSLLSSTSSMGRLGEVRDLERGLVIGSHISKKCVRDITTLLKLPKSTVGDVIVKWEHESTTTPKTRLDWPHLMTDRDRRTSKKVVRETHQTLSQSRSATNCLASTSTVHRELRGMRFHGWAAAHKPNISPVNAERHLKWSKEWSRWPVDNWKHLIWIDESCYTIWQSDRRIWVWWIPASMCSTNCEILRRWHYSVGVFFTEFTWSSHDTAWKSKCRRVQGQFDLLHTVHGRRPVQWCRLSLSAWQCCLP